MSSIRPTLTLSTIGLPPCCPFCGETTHADPAYTTGAPCAPCQAKSDAYQARLEGCPYGREHLDGVPCSACTDS